MQQRSWLPYAVLTVLWLIPILTVGFSRKTRGKEKLAWWLLTLGGGAFVLIAYLILAPITGPDEPSNESPASD